MSGTAGDNQVRLTSCVWFIWCGLRQNGIDPPGVYLVSGVRVFYLLSSIYAAAARRVVTQNTLYSKRIQTVLTRNSSNLRLTSLKYFDKMSLCFSIDGHAHPAAAQQKCVVLWGEKLQALAQAARLSIARARHAYLNGVAYRCCCAAEL